MVLKGIVHSVSVDGVDVEIQTSPAWTRKFRWDPTRPSTYQFSPGDRVVWQPAFEMHFDFAASQMVIHDRLVRETDLTDDERAEAEADLARQRHNRDVEREYVNQIRGRRLDRGRWPAAY